MASKFSVFLAELKRRKVIRVAIVYVIVGIALIEAADLLLPTLRLQAAYPYVVILTLLGFPIALVLAWAVDVTPEGIQRTPALTTEKAARGTATAAASGPDPAATGADSAAAGPDPAAASGADSARAQTPAAAQSEATGSGGVLSSIVVLPFENLSEDPEQEFFVAGMHDALITELAQISALRVISRTSAMAYKDKRVPVPQIARELNVDGILEASVFRVGDSVRIQAQLIQAFPEEGHLWAHTFDREMSDVLAMHSEVARAVAREVEIGLTPQEENRLDSVRSVTPETYELYLKGMFHLNKLTPEGFEIGLRYLDQAVENDPGEPLPYAGLALGWAIIGHTPSPPPDALLKAEAFALTALELDDCLAEAHAALAEVRIYHDWDLEGAGEAFNRALELNPNLAMTRGHYSWYLILDHPEEVALPELKRARGLDPLNPVYSAWLGWRYLFAGQWDDALDEARKSIELDPDFPIGHYVMGCAYTGQGKLEEAVAAHQKAGASSPMWKWGLGCAYAEFGREAEARAVARELEENPTGWDAWGLAEIYAALGEKDEALRWLEAALERRHSYIPWLNRFPAFKSLRDDPRFQDLARRGNAPS
jgi:TolB-like protein/tetratricopeptide (TPR) repeat protein